MPLWFNSLEQLVSKKTDIPQSIEIIFLLQMIVKELITCEF